MHYRLRTLVILTAVGPPVLAAIWFWGLPAFVYWASPQTYKAAIVNGIAGTVVIMFGTVLLYWWWQYLSQRAKTNI